MNFNEIFFINHLFFMKNMCQESKNIKKNI